MKTITYLFFALLLLIGKTDIKAQAVYGGIVPNYSQLILSNLSTGGGCSGGTPDIYFNLDGDTLDEIKVYSTGYCEISNIGLKHYFHSYVASTDTSIEFLWFSGSYNDYCEPRPKIKVQNYNTVIPILGNWKHDTFSVYCDVYSLGCVGGYLLGNNYIPFRKKYAANFYLYGWLHVSNAPNAFYTQFFSYTKLPNHASGIYDTITCNSSYTFVDGLTLNNILNDTTYISTFVHPITGLDSLVLTYLHVNTYQNTYYDTICAGSTFTFADGSSAVLWQDTMKQNSFNLVSGCDSLIINAVEVKPNSTSSINYTGCFILLPYTWQGQQIYSPGNYYHQTINSIGCDSTITLHFSIDSDTSSSTSVNVCSNQLPYVWNGITITTNGNYEYTTNNNNGCDSVAHLILNIINSSSSNENLVVCSNQLPYPWNGQNLNSSGSYTYVTTNSLGCDSTVTLNFTVNSTSSSTENISVCSNQLPFSWNGQNLNSSGSYTYVTSNSLGCDSTVTLNFTVNSTSSSTENISVCSNQLPYSWNGQSLSSSGSYTYVTTNSLGCDSIVFLNFFVLPNTSSTSTVAICSNQLPYVWNGQNLTTTGNYSFMSTGVNGCDSSSQLNLTVNSIPVPTIQWTGTNFQTQSYFTSYQWYYNGSLINGAVDSIYNPTSSGDYTVEVTDSNGCSNLSLAYNFIPVSVHSNISENISIYPNPVHQTLQIKYCNLPKYDLIILDMQGREIFKKFYDGKITNDIVDMSSYAKGIYMVFVISDKKKYTFRVMKD